MSSFVGGFLMEMIIDLRDPSMFAVSKDEGREEDWDSGRWGGLC